MEEKKPDKSQKNSRLEMVFGIIFGFSTAGVIFNLLLIGFSPDLASSMLPFWFIIALISGLLMFYFRGKK
jgi:hypothetical protein